MFIGVTPRMFNLHLKDCRYRFNNRNKGLHQVLLKLLKVKLYIDLQIKMRNDV